MEDELRGSDGEGLDVWLQLFVKLRAPKVINLRSDPFEKSIDSSFYPRWIVERSFPVVPAQGAVAAHLQTFRDFPPRQRPASFSVDQLMDSMQRRPRTQ
jgi:hypothetical protein